MNPEHDAPENEWQYLQETILLLNLATARIEQSLRDGDQSISTLTGSFSYLADSLTTIQQSAAQLEASPERTSILSVCETANGRIQNGIVAFQFYDRLNQRLSHVSRSLEELNGIIGNARQRHDPQAWKTLQERIRRQYTLDDDQKLLEGILAGRPVAEVLQEMRDQPGQRDDPDDVEMF